jgi:hypothetical protein
MLTLLSSVDSEGFRSKAKEVSARSQEKSRMAFSIKEGSWNPEPVPIQRQDLGRD